MHLHQYRQHLLSDQGSEDERVSVLVKDSKFFKLVEFLDELKCPEFSILSNQQAIECFDGRTLPNGLQRLVPEFSDCEVINATQSRDRSTKPTGKRPERLDPKKHGSWISWENMVYETSNGKELGAGRAWNSHKEKLVGLGIESKAEFDAIHKRKRNEANPEN